MKKLHIILIILLALLLAVTIGYGLLSLYASQDTVPNAVRTHGLPLGGLEIGQAIAALDQLWSQYEHREAMIAAGTVAGKKWTLQELGYAIQREPAAAALRKLQSGNVWERALYRLQLRGPLPAPATWDYEVFEQRVKEEWGWLEHQQAENAKRTITNDGRILYREHANAYRIDAAALYKLAYAWAAASATGTAMLQAELPVQLLPPAVTLEQLKAQGVERQISAYTTYYRNSSSGRAYNIEATAAVLDNWLLAPGEVFDYRKVVHIVERGKGYRPAPVILNGVMTQGIGGGICQVSSTLYQAALLAGLEIVERRNHSLPIRYMPLGQDATFADGSINFRFRNTTDHWVVIRMQSGNGQLTAKLYGTMPKGVSYTIESRTVKELPPPVQQRGSRAVPKGKRVLITPGKPGYIVETYRVKWENGKQAGKELVSRDTYAARPSVFAVAPGVPGSPDNDGNLGSEGSPGSGGTSIRQKPLLEDGIR